MTFVNAFGALHHQFSTLHPSDREVTITVTPEAMLAMAKEVNEANLIKLSVAEMHALKELVFYGMKVIKAPQKEPAQ